MTEDVKAKVLADSYSREELALKRGVCVRTLVNLLCQSPDRKVLGQGQKQRIDKAWADSWLAKEMRKASRKR